jgi:hypothetical protein
MGIAGIITGLISIIGNIITIIVLVWALLFAAKSADGFIEDAKSASDEFSTEIDVNVDDIDVKSLITDLLKSE